MKNLLSFILTLFVLALINLSCEEQTKGSSDETTQVQLDTLPGVVRDMVTKLPLSGVQIEIQGNTEMVLFSDPKGAFILEFDTKKPMTAQYTMAGFVSLEQEYISIDGLEQLDIYLEPTTTVNAPNKTISGETLKINPNKPNSFVTVDSIRIIEIANSGRDSIFSNTNGGYEMPYQNNNPTFEFQFKVGTFSQIHTVGIKNTSDIKDSTKIDIILTSNAAGIDIKPTKD